MLKLCVICHTIGKPYDLYSPDSPVADTLIGILRDSLIGVCPKCENKNCMIPIDSPRAQKLIKEYDIEIKEFVREPVVEEFVWNKDKK